MIDKRIVTAFLAIFIVTLLLAGCSTGRNAEENPAQKPPAETGHEQNAGNKESPAKTTMQVFFARDNGSTAEMVPVIREVEVESKEPAVLARKALELLQAGPTAEEKKQGLANNIPAAQLLDIQVQRPHVILNFNKEFEQVGGAYRVGCIIDQLTYTMSAIPGIKSVILKVEGEQVGTSEHPYTGEGLLFNRLTIDPGSELSATLGPADTLDLFIAVIPDAGQMWALMGPHAREIYKQPGGIETSAFGEGLGCWKNYHVVEENIEGNVAVVIIKGDQVLEGTKEKDATYTAYMVKENGTWKWDFPPAS